MSRTGRASRRTRESAPLEATLARTYFVLHAVVVAVAIVSVSVLRHLLERVVRDFDPEETRATAEFLADPVVQFLMQPPIQNYVQFGWDHWFIVAHAVSLVAYVIGALPGRSRSVWVLRLVLLVIAPLSGWVAHRTSGLALSSACAVPLLWCWFSASVRGWHGLGKAKTGLRSVLARRVLRGD